MKQQRHIQTTRTLLSRFRYWGRKNYAAFASMGREFQIGHLHTNVVDVGMQMTDLEFASSAYQCSRRCSS